MPRRSCFSILAALLLIACNDPARPGKRIGKPANPAVLCACKPFHHQRRLADRVQEWNSSKKRASRHHCGRNTRMAARAGAGSSNGKVGQGADPVSCRQGLSANCFFRSSDCDLHLEISGEASKDAPRMIVETPGTSEYCSPRTTLFAELQSRGITDRCESGALATLSSGSNWCAFSGSGTSRVVCQRQRQSRYPMGAAPGDDQDFALTMSRYVIGAPVTRERWLDRDFRIANLRRADKRYRGSAASDPTG